VLGIFWKRATAAGCVAGMVVGLAFTAIYMYLTLYQDMEHWFGISPEGIGTIGAALNFIVAFVVSQVTREPSPEVQALVEEVRHPRIETAPAPAASPARGR